MPSPIVTCYMYLVKGLLFFEGKWRKSGSQGERKSGKRSGRSGELNK